MATRGKYWVTEPDQATDIAARMNSLPYGDKPPKTVVQVLLETVEKHGTRPALCVKVPINGVVPKEWKTWTWNEYWRDCRSYAKSLVFLGVEKFQIINILGFNSPEWFIANTGSIAAGCIAAGIYTTNTAEACKYVSEHSRAQLVTLEGNKQLAKYVDLTLPLLKAIVVWGEVADPALVARSKVPVYSWDEFLALGAAVPEVDIDARTLDLQPGHCASLIYTSGTTGPPKAVMISHDNLTWTASNIIENYVDMSHEDCVISYLPLSHIAAQLIDIHCLQALGGTTYFAQPDALKGSLTTTLREVRPTIFFGVPRVWEKIQEKMAQLGRETTGVKRMISTWAKGCGSENTRLSQFGCPDTRKPWGYGCAKSIVLSKIREALGLDRAKLTLTAAAPISEDTLLYFGSLDIPIYEVFGQSECTGPHTVSSPGNWRIGYCGRPIRGTETKIAADTQELCYRGRHIFMGYMYMPEQSASTIDEEGYLHSGDVAAFDDNDYPDVPKPSGFMKITGRIKELIITAGGENVPPVLIEDAMKNAMPLALSNVMVVGDRRKFLAMLVSLKVDMDPETAAPTDQLAKDALFVGQQIGSTATTYTQAKDDPRWIEYINAGVKKGNSKTTSNAQIVQKWKWLPADFSEKAGELTPTLKLKRNVVSAKYQDLIESIYAEAGDDK